MIAQILEPATQHTCDERGSGRYPNPRHNWTMIDPDSCIVYDRVHPNVYDLRFERRHSSRALLGRIEYSENFGWLICNIERQAIPKTESTSFNSYEEAGQWLYDQYLESKRQAVRIALAS